MASIDHPTSLAARALAAADPRSDCAPSPRYAPSSTHSRATRCARRSSAGSSWSDVAGALGGVRSSRRTSVFAGRLQSPPSRSGADASNGGGRVTCASARQASSRARRGTGARPCRGRPGPFAAGAHDGTGSAAAAALAAIGVEFDVLRDAVGRLGLPIARPASVSPRRIPIADSTRAALEQSLREARRLGHDHLGVEHLLLGMCATRHGRASRRWACRRLVR